MLSQFGLDDKIAKADDKLDDILSLASTTQIELEEVSSASKPRASIRSDSPPPAVQELPVEVRED